MKRVASRLAAAKRARGKPKSPAAQARFYYKGNRIKQLRAFCFAVKFGSVARAADALFLSPSSVSLQLSALESELDAHLLERTRPRLALTPEGQMLYDLARPLVEGMDNLYQQFASQRQGMDAGEVNIAAGASTIQYLLPPPVRDYRREFPDVRLQLSNVTGKDGLAMLRSDQVDFAVGSMLDVPHDISYEPVHWFDPMLILPLDHPLAKNPKFRLGGFFAVWLDPAAATPDHVSPCRPRVPTTQGAIFGGDRSRRLGSDQTICGDGSGHLHRHRHLHPGRRTTRVWPCATCVSIFRNAVTASSCAKEIPVPTGTRLHRPHQTRPVRPRRLLRVRALGSLKPGWATTRNPSSSRGGLGGNGADLRYRNIAPIQETFPHPSVLGERPSFAPSPPIHRGRGLG